jgi:hypothetical protein
MVAPDAALPSLPSSEVLPPGRDPRRFQPKPKVVAPRPPVANTPVASQLAPLPPPIEVRPVPPAFVARPKPKPPLVLTPPIANPN